MEKGVPSKIYREHILELYKNSENFGKIKRPTYEFTEYNSLCGDEITVQILSKRGKVVDAKFSGSGCILSVVSSSLLMGFIKGKKISEVKKISKEDIIKLLKIKITPSRMRCCLLPLEAAKHALKNAQY